MAGEYKPPMEGYTKSDMMNTLKEEDREVQKKLGLDLTKENKAVKDGNVVEISKLRSMA